MSDEIKKQEVFLADGRKAEKIVQEEGDATTGESKIVTEVWAEPKIDKKLTQRIAEYKKPVVHRREIETVDEATGEVVERKVESIDPDVRMELREHIHTNNQLSTLSVKEDCDCYVTQEDMQKTLSEGLITVVKALKEKDEEESTEPLSMLSVVGEKIESANSGLDSTGKVLWGVIAALSAVFVYVVFLM